MLSHLRDRLFTPTPIDHLISRNRSALMEAAGRKPGRPPKRPLPPGPQPGAKRARLALSPQAKPSRRSTRLGDPSATSLRSGKKRVQKNAEDGVRKKILKNALKTQRSRKREGKPPPRRAAVTRRSVETPVKELRSTKKTRMTEEVSDSGPKRKKRRKADSMVWIKKRLTKPKAKTSEEGGRRTVSPPAKSGKKPRSGDVGDPPPPLENSLAAPAEAAPARMPKLEPAAKAPRPRQRQRDSRLLRSPKSELPPPHRHRPPVARPNVDTLNPTSSVSLPSSDVTRLPPSTTVPVTSTATLSTPVTPTASSSTASTPTTPTASSPIATTPTPTATTPSTLTAMTPSTPAPSPSIPTPSAPSPCIPNVPIPSSPTVTTSSTTLALSPSTQTAPSSTPTSPTVSTPTTLPSALVLSPPTVFTSSIVPTSPSPNPPTTTVSIPASPTTSTTTSPSPPPLDTTVALPITLPLSPSAPSPTTLPPSLPVASPVTPTHSDIPPQIPNENDISSIAKPEQPSDLPTEEHMSLFLPSSPGDSFDEKPNLTSMDEDIDKQTKPNSCANDLEEKHIASGQDILMVARDDILDVSLEKDNFSSDEVSKVILDTPITLVSIDRDPKVIIDGELHLKSDSVVKVIPERERESLIVEEEEVVLLKGDSASPDDVSITQEEESALLEEDIEEKEEEVEKKPRKGDTKKIGEKEGGEGASEDEKPCSLLEITGRVEPRTEEAAPDADSTSDLSANPQRSPDDSFGDLSLFLPEDEGDVLNGPKDRPEEPDSTQPKEEPSVPKKDPETQEDSSSSSASSLSLSSGECKEEPAKKDGEPATTLAPVEEPVERQAMKEKVLEALGLKLADGRPPIRKPLPDGQAYTGTLKAVIKLNRGTDKKSRTMVYRRSDDNSPPESIEYRICNTDTLPPSNESNVGGHQNHTNQQQQHHITEHQRKPQQAVGKPIHHAEYEPSSHSSSINGSHVQGEGVESDDLSKACAAKESNLVIPEKSSSFSIHPGRLCSDVCSYCFGKFGSLDTPCHVAQLKGEERQRKILTNEPHLTVESCLCDACYRYVDRKANCPGGGRTGSGGMGSSSGSSGRCKPPAASSLCCVAQCTQPATHTVKRKWLLKLKRSISNKLDIDIDKPGSMYLPLCGQHHYWVEYFTVCGICRKRLNRNHLFSLGSETDRLNLMLAADGIPARLSDKLFLCKLCRYYSNLRLKYIDPTAIPPANRSFYRDYRRKILISLNIAVSDSEEESGVGEDQEKKSGSGGGGVKEGGREESCSGGPKDQMALRGLANLLDQPEQPRIQVKFGNVNIGTLSNLNIGPERSGSTFDPVQPPLSAQFDFQGPSTPDGSWERCVSTIQFDKRTKKLWTELQRPYGNQSSFLRHLVMLEKYLRAGWLTLAEGADPQAVKYITGVRNRLKAFNPVASAASPPQQLTASQPPSTQQSLMAGKQNGASSYCPLITDTGEIEVTAIAPSPVPTVSSGKGQAGGSPPTVGLPLGTAPVQCRPTPQPGVAIKKEVGRVPQQPAGSYQTAQVAVSYQTAQAAVSYQTALQRAKTLVRVAPPPQPPPLPPPPPARGLPPPLLKLPQNPSYFLTVPSVRPRPIFPKLPKNLTVTRLTPSAITLHSSGITIEKQSPGAAPPPVLPPEKPSISVFREPLPHQ